MRRGPCMGACPVYRISFNTSGEAEYIGEHFVRRVGRYVGVVESKTFSRLAAVIERLGFFALEQAYPAPMTCQPSTEIKVLRDGRNTSVTVDADFGPAEFWAI